MPAEVLADDETIERTDIAVDETLLEPVLGELLELDKDVELQVLVVEVTRDLLGDDDSLEATPDDNGELELAAEVFAAG